MKKSIFTELNLLLKRKNGFLLPTLIATLIPIIFMFFYLSAGSETVKAPDLPVAVVNTDEGYGAGEGRINLGEELVKVLKKDDSLGWEFVNEDVADKGLKDNKYFLVIKVPNNFSSSVATVLSDKPEKLNLEYIQNEGMSKSIANSTTTAVKTIADNLSNQVVAKYINTAFSSIDTMRAGYVAAADGSSQIYNGTLKLKDGTYTMYNTVKSQSSNIKALADGANKLSGGTQQLYDSLVGQKSNVGALANGAAQLDGGAKDLNQGAKGVKAGLTQALNGTEGFKNQLSNQLLPGSQLVVNSILDAKTKINDLSKGATYETSLLNAYLRKHPELKTDTDFMTILGYSSSVSKGVTALTDSKLGVPALEAGILQVHGGIKASVAGTQSIIDGLNQLSAGQDKIVAGTESLSSGTSQLKNGNQSLKLGWDTMISGTNTINSGMKQVDSGTGELSKNWGALVSGAEQIDNGVVTLSDGTKLLSSSLSEAVQKTKDIKTKDDNKNMFGSPVKIVGSKVNEFKQYKDSLASHYIAIALFISLALMTIFIDLKKTTLGVDYTSLSSRLMSLSIIAVIQSIVVSIFAMVITKITISNYLLFLLFTIVVSLSFLYFILLLIYLLGNVGRFVLLGLILLQITVSGGLIPVEAMPSNIKFVSELLPMTHVIAGFKSLISLNNNSAVVRQLFLLLGYLVVSSIVIVIVSLIKKDTNINNSENKAISSSI